MVSTIGPRLRELRLQRSLSLQQLADRSGVSSAAIHKIERSGMVPTITTLLRLADALERPVAYFIDEEHVRAGPVSVTPEKSRLLVSTRQGIDVHAVSGSYARFLMDATVVTVRPGAGSRATRPESQNEHLVFVLKGLLRFELDGTVYDLGAGDTLHLRADGPFMWTNPGQARAEALWVTRRSL